MAMAAALIATRQMKDQNITDYVVLRAEEIWNGLERLMKKFSIIEDISGRGLMIAFSVGNKENVKKLVKNLHDQGVKTSLSTGKYIRFLPPTIINKGEVQEFLKRLEKALEILQCNSYDN
jgi:acetylornithine/succinyldiaminopimelate/putrescine aminotransferase